MPGTLGRLQQVRRIGVGGFASVWLYRDERLDSYVAVKALADNWAQQLDVRERFLEEARLLRRAGSDHVVEVYDIGETDDDTPYFVMTYADLGTVSDLLRAGAVDLDTVVDLVEQAARGIADLHAAGIVHRDIKPPNLLLRSDRQRPHRLLVADLGLAKALMYASGLTQIVGSPAYMAPEQAMHGTGVDERADVHALGAVAYHLLTGRPMRDLTIGQVPHAGLPELPSRVAALPERIDDVILRAIQPDPDARWPEPVGFAAALRSAAGTRPGSLPPTKLLPPDPMSAAPPVPVSAAPTAPVSAAPPVPTPQPASALRTPAEPRRSWRPRGLLAATVLVAAAVAVGSVLWLTGDDDPSAGDGTGAESSDPTDSAASDGDVDPSDVPYCDTFTNTWDTLQALDFQGDQIGTDYEVAVEVIHEARLAAPDPVKADWGRIDDPFQEFASVLEETDTDWADLDSGSIRPDARPRVLAAVQKLEGAFEDLGTDPTIILDARARCELDPSQLDLR